MSELLPCPFCGAKAEPRSAFKPTIEESLSAEPHINCSEPGCAGRHVGASLKEWQFRVTELSAALDAVKQKDRAIENVSEAFSPIYWAAEKAGVNVISESPVAVAKAIKAHIEKLNDAVKRRDEVIDSIAATMNRCLSSGNKLTRICAILNAWWPEKQKAAKVGGDG